MITIHGKTPAPTAAQTNRHLAPRTPPLWRRMLKPFARRYRSYSGALLSLLWPTADRRVHRCPLCGYVGPFGPFGGGPRPQAQCLLCGSLERQRFIHFVLRREMGFRQFQRPALLLAPGSRAETRHLRQHFPLVITADLVREDVDAQIDLQAIPYPDGYLDLIIAVHVLDEVENDRVAIAECHRVLGAGGWLIAPVPAFAAATQELIQRDVDGKIRHAGEDYEQRILAAGFRKAGEFRPSDFPQESRTYQFKEYWRRPRYRIEEPLQIFVK